MWRTANPFDSDWWTALPVNFPAMTAAQNGWYLEKVRTTGMTAASTSWAVFFECIVQRRRVDSGTLVLERIILM